MHHSDDNCDVQIRWEWGPDIQTVGSNTTNFLWDPSGALPVLLREVAGSATTYYIYGPGGRPLEQISGSTVLYYHQDQLGSTRAMTDTAGAVKATYTYDAYGSVSACTGTTVIVGGSNICTGTITVSNPFRYAGQYTDAESGKIYLRARYYDPSTGQFISRDPAVATTREPYAYAPWRSGICRPCIGEPLTYASAEVGG